jgi:hypothetical protein
MQAADRGGVIASRRTRAASTGVLAAALLAAGAPVPGAAPPAAAAAPTVQASACPAGSALFAGGPVRTLRPARGVLVRSWLTADARGHGVRFTVAQADLRAVRLGAASPSRFGAAGSTSGLVAGTTGAVVGVNGDYFAYDWAGAAIPYGPLVRGGRVLRLPPGTRPAVAADAGGRPVAGGVRVSGTVAAGRARLPVVSVNDDGDVGRDTGVRDPATTGGVAVVTSWAGTARPRRTVEVVLRRGVVRAVARRVPFGRGQRWGSGPAGQGDVLLSASGAGARVLQRLAPGARVAVRYTARTATGVLVRDAVGSGAALLRDGRVLAPCSGTGARSRPRTMVAWDAARRRVWLLVVTGSGPGTAVSRYGAPYRQLAQAAKALGASDAVMLDGGGSSTMAVRTGRTALRVDAPAGTLQRPVPDAVVLVRR